MNWRLMGGSLSWSSSVVLWGTVGLFTVIAALLLSRTFSLDLIQVPLLELEIVLGFVVGSTLSYNVAKLLSKGSCWRLPGLRRSLTTRVALACAVLVAPIPLVVSRFDVGLAFVLFAWGCCVSALGLFVFLRSVHLLFSRPLFAGILAVIVVLYAEKLTDIVRVSLRMYWSKIGTDWRMGLFLSLLAVVSLGNAIPSPKIVRRRFGTRSSGGSNLRQQGGEVSGLEPEALARMSLYSVRISRQGVEPEVPVLAGRTPGNGAPTMIWFRVWSRELFVQVAIGAALLLAELAVGLTYCRLRAIDAEVLYTVEWRSLWFLILMSALVMVTTRFTRPLLAWRRPMARRELAREVFLWRLSRLLSFVVVSLLWVLAYTTVMNVAGKTGYVGAAKTWRVFLIFLPFSLYALPGLQWVQSPVRANLGENWAALVLLLPIFMALDIAVHLRLGITSWLGVVAILVIAALAQALSWWGLQYLYRHVDLV